MTSIVKDKSSSRWQGLFASLNSINRDIRLVTLHPGLHQDPIHCSLQIVSLDSKPVFEALSYTWGSPSPTAQILLDGHPFEVTVNLDSALRQIRKPTTPRVLWIDAICIDQVNTTEKTHQVKLMGDIYRASQHCLVWLGTIESLSLTQSQAEAAAELWEFFASGKHISEMAVFQPDGYARHHDALQGIGRVMRSPWWYRIWTVQEAILPRATTLMWGQNSLSWESLEQARDSVMVHCYECCGVEWSKLPWGPGESHSFFLFTKTVSWMASTRAAVLDGSVAPGGTLWAFRERDAIDPRDKILGLLGFFPNWSLNSEEVDYYSMNKVQLYHHMTRSLIHLEKSLSILVGSDRKHLNRPIDLASWAIDWQTWDWIGIHPYWSRHQRYTFYSADKNSDVVLGPELEPNVLGLGGIFVDRVIAVGKIPRKRLNGDLCDEDKLDLELTDFKKWEETGALEGDVSDEDRLVGIKEWDQLSQKHGLKNKNYIAGGTWKNAFWRTLVGDLMFDESNSMPSRRASSADERRFAAYLNRNFDEAKQFSASMGDMTTLGSFFITQRGYMGFGPRKLEIDDELWILFGSRVPYSLRKFHGAMSSEPGHELSDKDYVSVGESYVHGIMMGEMLDAVDVHIETVFLH